MLRRPGFLVYGLLSAFILGSLFPFYWSVVIGSVTGARANRDPQPLIPGHELMNNISRVFDRIDFWSALANSVFVSGVASASVILFSTLAGFAFAKLRFRGSNALMVLVVATIAIPTQLSLVPLYKELANLGLVGTRFSVILPWLVTAFGVFFMRQYLVDAIPDELIEAARVDGASMIRTFWSVGLPAARPAAATLALFVFVGSWNTYFWPRIMLRTENTLPLIIPLLNGQFSQDVPAVLAGVFLVSLPLLVAFIFLGKQLVSGVMAGAVKG